MPWSNQSGGQNGGSGGGRGPWGNSPKGNGSGGGPRGPEPDLEELFRRGGDKFKSTFGGEGGSGGGSMLFGVLIALALVVWVFKSFYTVQPDELAVELRFGEPKQEIISQGLQFHFWPFETKEIVPTRVNQIDIGSVGSSNSVSSGLMLSGDQNIVDLKFTVQWQVDNPGFYLFNVADPDGAIRQVSESAMREIVGRRPAQDVFRDNRTAIAAEVLEVVRGAVKDYNLGVAITSINIEDAAPPPEVADAFDEVQRAEQDEDRFREVANREANRILGQARGEAAKLREGASAYKTRVVEEATGEAKRFLSVLEEYQKAPEVTRQRLYFESIAPVLSGSNKIILESGEGGSGVVPYLPLPQIQKEQQKNAAPSNTGSAN